MTHDKTVESQLASHEQAIVSLGKSLADVANAVQRVEASQDAGFRDLHNRFSEARKPQYALVFGTIFAAASVLLTIVGGVGSIVLNGQARDIARIESVSQSLAAVVKQHDDAQHDVNANFASLLGKWEADSDANQERIHGITDWLKTVSERAYENQKNIAALNTHLEDTVSSLMIQETRLQNEIKLTNERTESLVNATDKRLQDEIAREKEAFHRTANSLENTINRNIAEQTQSAKDRSNLDARVTNLESGLRLRVRERD